MDQEVFRASKTGNCYLNKEPKYHNRKIIIQNHSSHRSGMAERVKGVGNPCKKGPKFNASRETKGKHISLSGPESDIRTLINTIGKSRNGSGIFAGRMNSITKTQGNEKQEKDKECAVRFLVMRKKKFGQQCVINFSIKINLAITRSKSTLCF